MNSHRYIARFVVEADTPLFVGSGEASLITDALVQRDFNGLPMIYGTSLAGVLRHSLEDFDQDNSITWKNIFGFQDRKKGCGSRLKVSNAYMMISETKCAEGIQEIDNYILNKYRNLPVRQHVSINDKGAAVKGGLFDNEVCYKGTRFIFEMELIGNEEDKHSWQKILQSINNPAFRIGQGTRNGYGKLKVVKEYFRVFDLIKDFNDYTDYDPSLNAPLEFKFLEKDNKDKVYKETNFTEYRLELEPDSFFFNFSSGYGDKDVDNTPFTEEVAIYKPNGVVFEERTVIPASSIKGAISHRVCFHYNKLKGNFAESIDIDDRKNFIGSQNDAVFKLFGGEQHRLNKSTGESNNKINKKRGKVILNDLYYHDVRNDKIFNHVAIDRFTGGGMDGALFSEKGSYKEDNKIELSIFLEPFKSDIDDIIVKAFEIALEDVCKGLLPLGGMTTKGYGIFVGNYFKNDQVKFEYEK